MVAESFRKSVETAMGKYDLMAKAVAAMRATGQLSKQDIELAVRDLAIAGAALADDINSALSEAA